MTLDSGTFDRLLTQRSGPELGRATVMHELGHLVGLDHVDDDAELMSKENHGSSTSAPTTVGTRRASRDGRHVRQISLSVRRIGAFMACDARCAQYDWNDPIGPSN